MMKRWFSVGMAALLALLAVLTILPAGAEPTAAQASSWAVLSYAYEGSSEKFRLEREHTFDRPVTVTCDPDVSYLTLDDDPTHCESLALTMAGRYAVKVVNSGTNESIRYTVYILPKVNITDGQVFTSYPAIECANAVVSIRVDAGTTNNRYLNSGDVVTGLGKHDLHIEGLNGETWDYKFYIKACSAEQIFDSESGKFGIALQVGTFDDLNVQVKVDNDAKILTNGERRVVTALGQHTLEVTKDGTPLSKTDFNSQPSADELKVQVELTLPDAELEAPLTVKLSYYNADFYLLSGYDEESGSYRKEKKIKGDYRVAVSGTHVIVAKDAGGNVIDSAFLRHDAEGDAGVSAKQLTLSYRNPHDLWALLSLIPPVVLLALAVLFLVKRRRIV